MIWDKVGATVGLVIGVCLIIFRKRVRSIYLKKHLEEHKASTRVKYQQQIQEMKLEGVFHRGLEIISIAFGLLLVLISAAEFFPQADSYIRYFLEYSLLTFFAACLAGLIELKFVAPFLTRNLTEYTRSHSENLNRSIQKNIESDEQNTTSDRSKEDAVIHTLRRKSLVYLIISFFVLFVTFAFAFYAVFILTS